MQHRRGAETADRDVDLAARLMLASWTVALVQAHAIFRDHGDSAAAQAVVLAIAGEGQAHET